MTRTYTLRAPSYFEHAAGLTPQGPVIVGPHLDVDTGTPEGARDPFKIARRFAHAAASQTGEPFAWGWFDARPAVCNALEAPRWMRVSGRTDRLTDSKP